VIRAAFQRPEDTDPVDTTKAEVAAVALSEGAALVNDVTGLRYDAVSRDVARAGAGLVLMHGRGQSKDMYREARYESVCGEVEGRAAGQPDRALAAELAHVGDSRSGPWFAKRAEHSYEALPGCRFSPSSGARSWSDSRKSFLNAAIGDRLPQDRDLATAAFVAAAAARRAHARVHNVRAMVDVVRVADRIRGGAGSSRC
jgi:dihydropteroate synthase